MSESESDKFEERVESEKELLEFAEQLALSSGQWLAEQRRNIIQLEYECKSNPIDLVTRFDREIEQRVVTRIREIYPHHLILGEETAVRKDDLSAVTQNQEICWVIDPLDGTMNFVHNISHYSVSIAAVKKGIPLVGVVYDPNADELFSAARGLGARLNGKLIKVSKQDAVKNSLLSTGFASEDWSIENPFRSDVQKVYGYCRSIRISGSSALDLAYIADGRIDGFWHRKLAPWDIAAGILLVEEAGGQVSSLEGPSFQFSDDYLIASNGLIQNTVINLLKYGSQ